MVHGDSEDIGDSGLASLHGNLSPLRRLKSNWCLL